MAWAVGQLGQWPGCLDALELWTVCIAKQAFSRVTVTTVYHTSRVSCASKAFTTAATTSVISTLCFGVPLSYRPSTCYKEDAAKSIHQASPVLSTSCLLASFASGIIGFMQALFLSASSCVDIDNQIATTSADSASQQSQPSCRAQTADFISSLLVTL